MSSINRNLNLDYLINHYGPQPVTGLISREKFTVDSEWLRKNQRYRRYTIDRFVDEFLVSLDNFDEYVGEDPDDYCPRCHVKFNSNNVCPECGALDERYY